MKRRDLGAGLVLVAVAAVLLFANRHVFLSSTYAAPLTKGDVLPAEESFPAAFPIYPGAVFIGADRSTKTIGGQRYHRAWFAADETGPKVNQWYQDQLGQRGYAPVAIAENRESTRYGFAPGQPAIQMEIFRERNQPARFSVDYYATPAR